MTGFNLDHQPQLGCMIYTFPIKEFILNPYKIVSLFYGSLCTDGYHVTFITDFFLKVMISVQTFEISSGRDSKRLR